MFVEEDQSNISSDLKLGSETSRKREEGSVRGTKAIPRQLHVAKTANKIDYGFDDIERDDRQGNKL